MHEMLFVCQSQAALTAQQRSTGFVLHYVRDLQLFAAAEVAAASASGSFTGGEAEQETIAQGAAEELMHRLYRQVNGNVDNAEQRTSTRFQKQRVWVASSPPQLLMCSKQMNVTELTGGVRM